MSSIGIIVVRVVRVIRVVAIVLIPCTFIAFMSALYPRILPACGIWLKGTVIFSRETQTPDVGPHIMDILVDFRENLQVVRHALDDMSDR